LTEKFRRKLGFEGLRNFTAGGGFHLEREAEKKKPKMKDSKKKSSSKSVGSPSRKNTGFFGGRWGGKTKERSVKRERGSEDSVGGNLVLSKALARGR